MTKRQIVVGIDTSNYTTSVALLSTEGELIANVKELLDVPEGQCGLRQSDALFQHVRRLPELIGRAKAACGDAEIVAVGVSTRPRNIEGSYMPVFLAGEASAEALSLGAGCPIYRFSHQCGHIMAALYSAGKRFSVGDGFAAVHLSGGTTELLRVSCLEAGFDAEIVGGTRDLNAGQVIDRIGVMLGMPFPAGRHLEAEALKYKGSIPRRKISREGMSVNLSGVVNIAERMYKDGEEAPKIAAFVFDYVGRAVVEMLSEYERTWGKSHVVCAGGVMCNSIIRSMIDARFDASFAEPAMSSDNAVGIAALALKSFNGDEK
ncbi:MAG: hypothetical protein IKC32_07200 [Clostridia bacterium]|nr:hypothetical protein [Clostridia bacterium]